MQLNDDCLIDIFKHLDGHSLYNAGLVSQQWQAASKRRKLWKRVKIHRCISRELFSALQEHETVELDLQQLDYDKEHEDCFWRIFHYVAEHLKSIRKVHLRW